MGVGDGGGVGGRYGFIPSAHDSKSDNSTIRMAPSLSFMIISSSGSGPWLWHFRTIIMLDSKHGIAKRRMVNDIFISTLKISDCRS